MRSGIYLLLGWLLLLTACAGESDDSPFSFNGITNNAVSLDWEGEAERTIPFHASTRWKAESSQEWLEVTPTEGSAGDYDLSLRLVEANLTGAARTAMVHFSAGTRSLSLEVTQASNGYFKLEQEKFTLQAAGGDIRINLSTDISIDDIALFPLQGAEEWITSTPQTDTKAIEHYYYALTVLPNGDSRSRTANLAVMRRSSRELLATVQVVQAGTQSEISTDFSSDGNVSVLQTATRGKGIPIVLMGDGFIDREIADGTYDKVMRQAMENLFYEEPVRTLRDYFTVYSVTAVSRNNEFGEGFDTAFDCELEGGTSTLIEGDEKAVQSYLEYIGDAKTLDWLEQEALAVVILNTTQYAGTTNFGFFDGTGNPTDFAIAYCPTIDGLESETFREVLQHEAIGHGFAKLMDEYAYDEQGTIPASEVKDYQKYQEYGWAQNVDFTADPTRILWHQFLDDYASSEGLGIYEGACTYIRGAYRPSEESIMRSNINGYNAPSRKAIYDRVLESSGSKKSDYAAFRAFDQQVPRTVGRFSVKSEGIRKDRKPFAPPRFVGKKF